jgi:hypothetical protein
MGKGCEVLAPVDTQEACVGKAHSNSVEGAFLEARADLGGAAWQCSQQCPLRLRKQGGGRTTVLSAPTFIMHAMHTALAS